MKKRTPGFLSEENIPHNSEVFSYIQELHDYLWKFTRIAKPNVSGIIDNFVDSAVDELAALRAERDEAVRLLAKSGIPYEAIRMDYESKKWIAEKVWNLIEETTNEIRAFLSKIEERK